MNRDKITLDVLIVDLDGSLLRSDSLQELFWRLVILSPGLAFGCILQWVLNGRHAFRLAVAHAVPELSVASWPWNQAVVDLIARYRARGVPIVLMTAADQRVADAVAQHFGWFDQAYGSTLQCDLRGERKRALICELYPTQNTGYVGDSAIDVPVWQGVTVAFGVGIDPANHGIPNTNSQTIALDSGTSGLAALMTACRPYQWVKNTLLFMPTLLAQQFQSAELLTVLLGFAAFSMLASAVYLFNDVVDLERDRDHPRKRYRPLASGAVSINLAMVLCVALACTGLMIALWLGWAFFLALLGYLVMTTLYSLVFKQVAWFDVLLLAGLYTWRLVAGALVADIALSWWLVAFSAGLFFTLATLKRFAELVDRKLHASGKTYGRSYRLNDLKTVALAIKGGFVIALTTLCLFLVFGLSSDLYPHSEVLWATPAILAAWLIRMYWVASHGAMTDDPIVYAIRDGWSWAGGLVVGVLVVIGGAWFA